MFKVSVLVWIVLGTVLAGVSLIVVLMVLSFAADAIRNIPMRSPWDSRLRCRCHTSWRARSNGGQGVSKA